MVKYVFGPEFMRLVFIRERGGSLMLNGIPALMIFYNENISDPNHEEYLVVQAQMVRVSDINDALTMLLAIKMWFH